MVRAPHAALLLACLAGPASAGIDVTVTVRGTVEWNQVTTGPLAQLAVDDPVELGFRLDSDDFVDSASFPTRGYRIDETSFALVSGATTVGLQNPYPGTPYFVLRDNDPAVDGFLVADSTDFPTGVDLEAAGGFGQFVNAFHVTYGGSLLGSLDLLDALGTYDFSGLSVYNWTVDDGPFNPIGIVFEELVIECTPLPPVTYCNGKLNSAGCVPFMTADAGIASLSGPPFHVTAHDLLNGKPGLIFYGFGPNAAPFQGGTLCIAPPHTRTPVQFAGGSAPPAIDCTGTMTLDVTAVVPASAAPAWVYLQGWARDPGDPFGTGLTNGVRVLVCP